MQLQLRRIAVVLAAILLAACTAAPAATPGALTVTDPWVRAAAALDRPTGAYLVITNGSGKTDALVGASSPAAKTVEMHETTRQSGGMMGMRPIPRLEIPTGGTVKLEPGGYDLMLIGLVKPLKAGDTVELELQFEQAGPINVRAAVRER